MQLLTLIPSRVLGVTCLVEVVVAPVVILALPIRLRGRDVMFRVALHPPHLLDPPAARTLSPDRVDMFQLDQMQLLLM